MLSYPWTWEVSALVDLTPPGTVKTSLTEVPKALNFEEARRQKSEPYFSLQKTARGRAWRCFSRGRRDATHSGQHAAPCCFAAGTRAVKCTFFCSSFHSELLPCHGGSRASLLVRLAAHGTCYIHCDLSVGSQSTLGSMAMGGVCTYHRSCMHTYGNKCVPETPWSCIWCKC